MGRLSRFGKQLGTMGVEWFREQQKGCQRMMNMLGNTLRALGYMLKDTKK
jgi:hypothetical protein